MPPKRKHVDVEKQPSGSSSRTTRSATRSGGAVAETSSASNLAASSSKSKTSAKSTAKDPPKKNTKSSKAKKKVKEPPQSDPESEEGIERPTPIKKGKKRKLTEPPISPKKIALPLPITCTLYSRLSMEKMFATYADQEDPSLIGSEGLERLCTDAKIPMEGAQPLLLAWLLAASELGKFEKEKWIKGLDALQIDTLEKLSFALSEYENLLISDMPAPRSPNKSHLTEPYNRNLNYWVYAADVPKAFLKFYAFMFTLAKAPQERNIDIEIAKAFWATLLSQKYPLANDLIEFINEKGTLRGVNKDLWGMTLDFCKTFSTSLEGYEPDGAWPTLLDEFSAWQRAKQPADATDCDEMDE